MTAVEEQARSIFLAALQRALEEWPEFLDGACAGNAELRGRVERLLRAHQAMGSIHGGGVERPLLTIDQPVVVERAGTVIGPYKLIEPIGEGGMGTVWMAQQTKPVKRVVALKLIKAGMDSAQVIARFEAERQALALMDHANISRVLDAGTTSAGRPYFVMDLVKGMPITRFCDEHHLTPRQRLELFVPVCQAVQHAHQKGIIHRDLKPTNVLVALYDGKPVPKVIDFGVAKATGQTLTDKTLVTGFGNIVGTLEYMSPEQAETNPLDIDTRSDIYSLGVLLYELLTGSTPFSRKDLEQAGMLEMLRVIREDEPAKPSTKLSTAEGLPTLAANRGTEPARLARLVRGELDWIVMKALEKDRSRRYETANGFAMDVQRYLADEPVQACPPSAAYRFHKFARRNRRSLVTASLMVLALLVAVGTVAGSIGWAASDRAARQAAVEKEAELALAEAERWVEQEKWPEALDAVKRGAGLLAGGGGGEIRDRLQRLRSDVEMMLRLEEVRLLATDLKDQWHESAAVDDGYEKAFAEYGIDVLDLPVDEAASRIRARGRLARRLAVALDFWTCSETTRGKSIRAKILAVAAAVDPDPWRQKLREAVQGGDGRALEQLADSPELMQQSRDIFLVVQHALLFSGKPDKSHAVLRLSQQQFPSDFWANYWLAHDLYWKPQSDRDEVISFARAAVAIRPKSAAAHLLLALALQRNEKLDEALAYHYKAIELAPNNPYAHHDLGWTLHLKGKSDEAIIYFQEAIELWPENFHAYGFLGRTLNAQKKPDEAIAAFRKATKLNPNAAHAHLALGDALRDGGKLDEAIDAYSKAIELDPNNVALLHEAVRLKPDVAQWQYNLGRVLAQQKKFAEAVAPLGEATRLDPDLQEAHTWLGLALIRIGKLGEAETALREAIRLNAVDSWALSELGNVLRGQKKLAEAIEPLRKSLQLDPTRTYLHGTLGWIFVEQQQLASAEAEFRELIRLDPGNAGAHFAMGKVLSMQKKHPEAEEQLEVAVRLNPTDRHAHKTLGSTQFEQKKFALAERSYGKATLLAPDDADAFKSLGSALVEQMKFAEAEVPLREALRIDPHNRWAPRLLTEALVSQGKLADAKTFLTEAASREPDNAEPVIRLAEFLRQQKQFAEAEAEIRKAVQLDPKRPRTHDMLGAVLREQKKFAEAEAAFREAIQLMPELASAQLGLGLALHQQKRFAEAIEPLQEAIRLNPQDDLAHNTLGWALLDLRRFPEAEAALRVRVRSLPSDAGAHYALGRALQEQKKFAEAEHMLRRALQLDPARTNIPGNLGWVLIGQEKWPEAEAAFREQIRLSPEVSGPRFGLGKVLSMQKRYADAEAALRDAIEIDPNYPASHAILGWVLFEQKRFTEAEAAYRAWIRLAPQDPGGLIGLGRVLVEQKKFSEAETTLREFLRLEPKNGVAPPLLRRALAGQGKEAEAKAFLEPPTPPAAGNQGSNSEEQTPEKQLP